MRLFALLSRLTQLRRFLPFSRRIFFWFSETEKVETYHHDHDLVLSVVAPERLPRWRQLRYLLRVCSPLERRLFTLSAVVAALTLILTSVRFIQSHLVTVPVVGGTFIEALIGEPKYINPLDAVENDVDRDLTRLIYSGLFRFSGLHLVPDLVERYSWSEDHKKLTVHLRKDARFHDGAPVTSEDVIFTFESMKDPARKSPLAPVLRGVTFSNPNSSTIIFELERPDTSFLTHLTIGILPEHSWQDVPRANARLSDLNLKPIGSGPYRVKSFSRDANGNIHSFTLERFDQYAGVKPFIKTVIFQFFIDRRQAVEALKAERVDALAFVKTPSRHQKISLELPQETVAFFNLKHPVLAHKEVRQAFALAVDRSDIALSIGEDEAIVSGPYPFEAASTTAVDLESARKLLQDNGWIIPPNGSVRVLKPKSTPRPVMLTSRRAKKTKRSKAQMVQTIPQENSTATSTELSITITLPNEPALVNIAGILKRQWSLLGARVTIETLPIEDLVRRATRERTAQVVLLNVLLAPDQDVFPFWSSSQAVDRGLNFSNLRDRAVDDAIEAARMATSTDALATARAIVTRAIQQHVPALFLLRPLQTYLVSAKIHGIEKSAMLASPSERFQNIEHWYVKTGWRWK